MELYEIMLIIRPDLEVEEQEDVLSGLSKVITKNEGTVNTVLDWRKRRLSYEIDKHKDGHYYLVYLSAPVTIIPEIEHYFRVTDAIIRFMILRSGEEEFEEAANKAAAEAARAAEPAEVAEDILPAEKDDQTKTESPVEAGETFEVLEADEAKEPDQTKEAVAATVSAKAEEPVETEEKEVPVEAEEAVAEESVKAKKPVKAAESVETDSASAEQKKTAEPVEEEVKKED